MTQGQNHYVFNADYSRPLCDNTHFWAACGVDSMFPMVLDSTGDYLFSRAQQYGTLRYMRNHHVLSELQHNGKNIGGDVYREDAQGNPVYNFSFINSVYARALSYGIKPVVEMDYMPRLLARKCPPGTVSCHGEDYERCSFPADWDKWRALLVAFTQNLVDTFGLAEVRTWYFEAWNEPDLCVVVPALQQWPVKDWPQFLRLYDVFADAVTSVDDQLRVGGPGTISTAFLLYFLNHVCNGTNYVTGKTGSRIDFISHHIYGIGGSTIDHYPLEISSAQTYVHELIQIKGILDQFPKLKGVPLHINEWGVSAQGGMSCRQHPALDRLRNSEYSALYLVKLINNLLGLRKECGITVDMLLYWGFCNEDYDQRTFDGTRSLTTFPNIPKPIQTVQEMLALLGDHFVCTDAPYGAPVSLFAAKSETGCQLVLYNFNETCTPEEAVSASCTVLLQNLLPGHYTLSCYTLDSRSNNTYAAFNEIRGTKIFEDEDYDKIRKAGQWGRDYSKTLTTDGTITLTENLSPCTMRLFTLERC